VPAPRSDTSPDGLAEPVPIGRRVAGSTAVLDEVVVPPWLRMPSLRLVTGPSRPVPAAAVERPAPAGPGTPAASGGSGTSTASGGSGAPAESGGSGASTASGGSGTSGGSGAPAASGGSSASGGASTRAGREAAPLRPVTDLAARRAAVLRPAVQTARPRIDDDSGILGLSRLTRGRVGSRLFTLFFVGVFTLIALQMVLELLHG
jgi:hypothetical protein